MIILIGLATFVSTLLGGLFALYFKDRLHLILGFSAGAVVGVAFFDLIPEAIELSSPMFEPSGVMAIVAIGFMIYMVLDRCAIFHRHVHAEDDHGHASRERGILGAISLSIHSGLDGLAIGIAFQVSSAVGLIVATAVLVHGFSDGINTTNLILKNVGGKVLATRFLFLDAIAPVIGITSTLFFSLSAEVLGIILAVFSGSFLYIGASDLLPESHHEHPTVWTTFTTIVGIAVLYVAIKLAGM